MSAAQRTEFPVLSCISGCGALTILTMNEIGPVYMAPVIKFPAIVFVIVVANMVAILTAWFYKKLADGLSLGQLEHRTVIRVMPLLAMF